jgi:hypothetical protein
MEKGLPFAANMIWRKPNAGTGHVSRKHGKCTIKGPYLLHLIRGLPSIEVAEKILEGVIAEEK